MRRHHLRFPILCLVTDPEACRGRPLEQVVAVAVEAGVGLVQLRQKQLSARQLLQLGSSLLEPVRRWGAALVVNDRVDVALALGADGVQLGGGSLPVAETRRLVGQGMLIGASVHSLEGALQAEGEGADYLLLGTIFETRSHPGLEPAGPGLVSRVAGAVRVPVIAIGGIKPDNAGSVMAAGASGVAVITAILSAQDAAAATGRLLCSMTQAHGSC
ncbi:MAG: thiamine phosphate synthase [Chloroflexi bacterium]|nr:thiamine phosphate synthase [Chloroflexota bacterium]